MSDAKPDAAPPPPPRIIRVIDFETTGLEPTDEVIEVGHCDLNRDTGSVEGGNSYLCGSRLPIPPEVRAVHHIWPVDIEGQPPFDPDKVLESALASGVVGFAAHMAEFEGQWLGRVLEGVMPLICTYKAALRVWPDAPSHSNFGLLYWLWDAGKIAPRRDRLMPPHRALPDSYATAHLLQAIFAQGATGPELVRWTREPRLYPTCTIGKHRGKKWADVDGGFLRWMLGVSDMEPDLKWCAQLELDRRNGA
jgi:exodeoxyribonuclease X